MKQKLSTAAVLIAIVISLQMASVGQSPETKGSSRVKLADKLTEVFKVGVFASDISENCTLVEIGEDYIVCDAQSGSGVSRRLIPFSQISQISIGTKPFLTLTNIRPFIDVDKVVKAIQEQTFEITMTSSQPYQKLSDANKLTGQAKATPRKPN